MSCMKLEILESSSQPRPTVSWWIVAWQIMRHFQTGPATFRFCGVRWVERGFILIMLGMESLGPIGVPSRGLLEEAWVFVLACVSARIVIITSVF